MSAYFYLLLQIYNLPYCSDTTISLCIPNSDIVSASITVAWSNLKTQPAPYQVLHISGGRLPQTLAKQARQRDKMKSKTFILPLLLPTSLSSKQPWEAGSSEQTLMCFGGEKLYHGAGNATVEHLLTSSLSCTWKPQSLRWSSSNPGLKLQKGAEPSLTKGQRLKSPSPTRLTQEFNCKYAIAVVPRLACFKWWKGSLREMRRAKRQGQLSS